MGILVSCHGVPAAAGENEQIGSGYSRNFLWSVKVTELPHPSTRSLGGAPWSAKPGHPPEGIVAGFNVEFGYHKSATRLWR